MAREKHIWNSFPFKNFWTRVNRPAEDSLGERIGVSGFSVTQCAVDQADNCVCYQHGGQFTTTDNEVAYGNFKIHFGLADAVVDSLVVSADQDQVLSFESSWAILWLKGTPSAVK